MDWIELEEQLARCNIYITSKPLPEVINDLKKVYDVTDLGNNRIQITYK